MSEYNPYENGPQVPQTEATQPESPQTFQSEAPRYVQPEAPRTSYYVPPTVPVTPPKKKSGIGKIIAVALVCSILGGILGAGGMYLTSTLTKSDEETAKMAQRIEDLQQQLEELEQQEPDRSSILQGQRDEVVLDTTQIQTGKRLTAAEVYAANVNSTVGITTSITTNYWGYTSTSAASGSGFIITEDGYILTNYHVIEDANTVTVTLYDGTAYEAEVVGYDSSNDLAVLKVDAEDLKPVVLGSSDKLLVGDDVVAIGNPLGELTFSLTAGYVSALDRQVTLSGGITMDLIQTDCAINSGNSGGALFNLYGEVIGITNAKYSGSSTSGASIDNIGFAIPIDSILNIVESIIEHGYVAKPYIGVMVGDVSEEAQRFGLPKGGAIQSVEEDSPAQAAGLQANDIVIEANGAVIEGRDDLVDAVGALEVGDELVLKVYRQGEEVTLTVIVGEQIQQAQQQTQQSQQSQQQQQSQNPFPGFGG